MMFQNQINKQIQHVKDSPYAALPDTPRPISGAGYEMLRYACPDRIFSVL